MTAIADKSPAPLVSEKIKMRMQNRIPGIKILRNVVKKVFIALFFYLSGSFTSKILHIKLTVTAGVDGFAAVDEDVVIDDA